MKKLVALFFMMLILSQLVVRLGVYVSWKLNQDYLVKTECVNRNVKGSCCKARCQLDKRMSKVDTNNQSNDSKKTPIHKVAEIEPFVLGEESKVIHNTCDEESDSNQYTLYQIEFLSSHLKAIFHPPNYLQC